MNKNKGFSLVELIVVVAIMAVLVGILAPAYLSYVEKTRRGADENMAEEVRHSCEIAAADIKVYDELKDGGTLTFSNGGAIQATGAGSIAANPSNLNEALNDVYSGKNFVTKSKKYSGWGLQVTVQGATAAGAALTFTSNWPQ